MKHRKGYVAGGSAVTEGLHYSSRYPNQIQLKQTHHTANSTKDVHFPARSRNPEHLQTPDLLGQLKMKLLDIALKVIKRKDHSDAGVAAKLPCGEFGIQSQFKVR